MSTQLTTKPLTRFWLTLERLPGQAAVVTEWRRRLRSDFDSALPLLLPDPELARLVPRRDRPGEYYTVVEHGPNDFVGVGEEGEGAVPVARQDLIVYRLDMTRLAMTVARALGIEPCPDPVDGITGAIQIGFYRPIAVGSFPVYLTIQLEPSEYRTVVEALVARTTGPFVLLAPTNNHHYRLVSRHLLDARNASFLALADGIRVGAGGLWEADESALAVLARFREQFLPAAEPRSQVSFPTPAGTTWSNLRIRLIDGETVAVKVGEVTRTLTYTQMGMADGRNAKPTVQWKLLRHFASGRGIMTWKSSGAEKNNQKRREKLAKNLVAFFGIPGEPIILTDDRKGWQTVFAIEGG